MTCLSRKLTLLAMAIISIILLCWLSSCTTHKQTCQYLRPVKYLYIGANLKGQGQKTFSGVLKSDVYTKLSFKVPGNVKTLDVEDGDFVKKGQVIATIDDELYVLEYEDALASVGEAKTRYVNAKKYYSRLAKLYLDGAISDRQLDDAKAEAEGSANALKSVQKKADYAKLRLNYTILSAPMDGYIASVETASNENLTAGAPVVRFISEKESEVNINIPESYINVIKRGQKAIVRFEAIGNKNFEGVIRDIGVDALSNSSTFPVTIELLNPTDELKSGMSATVTLKLESKDNYIVIPINSVMKDDKGEFVFLLEELGNERAKIHRLAVETGEIETDGIEIKKGLEEGDKIVTAGTSQIHEGMIVKVLPILGTKLND